MQHLLDRREAMTAAGLMLLAWRQGGRAEDPQRTKGWVEGHPLAARVGMKILAEGGNAVDAIVAAALAIGVAAPHQTGPGGYGGSAILALNGGKTVTSIDFNSAAPTAARAAMFAPGADGKVKGAVNQHGWLAAGVPGVLAGLQLALDRHGTRGLADVAAPAIALAADGFTVDRSLASALRNSAAGLKQDPASARLYLRDGEPLKEGDKLRNPDLAALLEKLAHAKSVAPFYRGEVARRIAAAFKAGGGLVTEEDLAGYKAREVEPLELSWRGAVIRTPPPTAGGLTMLQALAVLDVLGWAGWKENDARRGRARLEALRLAWDDRLELLGDPGKGVGPAARLLGARHIKEQAARVERALKDGKPAEAETDGRSSGGTIHLSAADDRGNWVALTLTHGGAFGARVTVPGLGLTLGHGMSRFDPRPDHPNAPRPGKRPLHNMCPTIVLRDGKPVLAVGGRGGRKIPNAVFEVLLQTIGRGATPAEALAVPRLHTEGGLTLETEKGWPDADVARFKQAGYTVKQAASAYVSAVWADPKTGSLTGASR